MQSTVTYVVHSLAGSHQVGSVIHKKRKRVGFDAPGNLPAIGKD